MRWKKYIPDIFLYKYTSPSYFIKKKKRVKDWPSIMRKRHKYYGYYLDRVFIDYRLPDDDDERFFPISKSKHRALKILFTFSSAKCVDEQQRVITGVISRFFQDWSELWYTRIGANSYLRLNKCVNRNFSNFSLVGAFARFFNVLYSSQPEMTRSFNKTGKESKEFEMEYPFYERLLDSLNLSEQKFFHLKGSGDWLHNACIPNSKTLSPWFNNRVANTLNLSEFVRFDSNYGALNLPTVLGSTDRRWLLGSESDLPLDSLFLGSDNFMDMYAGNSAYVRFIVLVGQKLRSVCSIKSKLDSGLLAFGQFRFLAPLPLSRVNVRRVLSWAVRCNFRLLVTKWGFFDFSSILDNIKLAPYFFLVKFWGGYLKLHRIHALSLVPCKYFSRVLNFNILTRLLLQSCSGVSGCRNSVSFGLPQLCSIRATRGLFSKETVVPPALMFFKLLRYGSLFFAFNGCLSWGTSLYEGIELVQNGEVFRLGGLISLNVAQLNGVYSLIRTFILSYFMKEFSERAELVDRSLGKVSSLLKFRTDAVLFNSAKFVTTRDDGSRYINFLVDLGYPLLNRFGLLTFLFDSIAGREVRDVFWVRRFYTGQVQEYVKGLLLKFEPFFCGEGIYREDFRVYLLRFFNTRMESNHAVVPFNYWTSTSINASPSISYLKFNLGAVNIVRFAQVGGAAFHHQFFLFLNLPLVSDVATRSVRHSLPETLPRSISSLDGEFLFFDRISQDFLVRGISKNARNSLVSTLGLGYCDAQSFFFDNYAKLGFFNHFDTIMYGCDSLEYCGGEWGSHYVLKFFFSSPVKLNRGDLFSNVGWVFQKSYTKAYLVGDAEMVRSWVGYELLYC